MTLSVEEQLAQIKQGSVDLIREEDLLKKLQRSRQSGKPLRVKLGVDPTAPDIHLGIAVVLRKLRQFQELGHLAVLIVGDFTGRIGDPSARASTRKLLSLEEIQRNMKDYQRQAFKILEPSLTEFRYNSEWLASMNFEGLIELASKYTVARMLERDDFAQRFSEGRPITILEFLYPLAQAYDSIAVQADVELGGTDQKFNLLVGREIQERYGQEPQVILTMPLLEGTDGIKKMSKSEDNYIGIEETPQNIYGKLMSIPDELIEKYFRLGTDVPYNSVKDLPPRKQKGRLAWEIVKIYHGKEKADEAQAEFERVFVEKERPKEVEQVFIKKEFIKEDGTIWIVDLVEQSGLVASRSEARRLIEQGAIEIDGRKINTTDYDLRFQEGMLLRVGKKRFVETKIKE